MPRLIKRPQLNRIGVVVPLASLLGSSDTPAELADRSGFIAGQMLRDQIAATLDPDSRDEVPLPDLHRTRRPVRS